MAQARGADDWPRRRCGGGAPSAVLDATRPAPDTAGRAGDGTSGRVGCAAGCPVRDARARCGRGARTSGLTLGRAGRSGGHGDSGRYAAPRAGSRRSSGRRRLLGVLPVPACGARSWGTLATQKPAFDHRVLFVPVLGETEDGGAALPEWAAALRPGRRLANVGHCGGPHFIQEQRG